MLKRLSFLLAVGLVAVLGLYGMASARHGVLVTQMDGSQEVNPESGETGAGDADGVGAARIRLLPDQDRVCFRLRWANIGAPTMAHIHEAEKGSNGGAVVPLFVDDDPLPDTIFAVNGCASGVDDGLSDRIRSNPKGFYVNIHNAEFPGGAIRGQLKHAPVR